MTFAVKKVDKDGGVTRPNYVTEMITTVVEEESTQVQTFIKLRLTRYFCSMDTIISARSGDLDHPGDYRSDHHHLHRVLCVAKEVPERK